MTYLTPELLLVGAAQTLVLGQCAGVAGPASNVGLTCQFLDSPGPTISRALPLW